MLNSKTVFWKGVFGEAKLEGRFGWRSEKVARRTAGVPWARERKQLEASGRDRPAHLRKIMV